MDQKVTGMHNHLPFIELNCRCDHHLAGKLLKWEINVDVCVCSGVQYHFIPVILANSKTYLDVPHPARGAFQQITAKLERVLGVKLCGSTGNKYTELLLSRKI